MGENFKEQDSEYIVATVKEKQLDLLKIKTQIGRENKDEVHESATMEVQAIAKYSNLISCLGEKSM
jgi:hypothetical protein